MSHKHRLAFEQPNNSEDVTLDLQSVIQSFNEDPQEKNEAKETPTGLFRVPEVAPQGHHGGLPRTTGRIRDQKDQSFCEPEPHEQLRTHSRSPMERSERDALLHNIAKLLSKDAAKSRSSSTVLSEVSGKKQVRETHAPCSPHPTRFSTGLKRTSVDILARLHSVVTEAYEQAKYDEELTTVLGSLLGYGSHIHTVGRQTELEPGGKKRREFDCRPFQGPKTPPSPNSKHKTGILLQKRRTKTSCGLRDTNEARSDNYIERIRVDPRNRVLKTKSSISHRHFMDPQDYLHSFDEDVSKGYCKPHRSQHSPHGRTHSHTHHHHITRNNKDQFVNLHDKRLHGSSCDCDRKLRCTGCMVERQSSRILPNTRTYSGSNECRSPFRNSQRRNDDRVTDEPTEQQMQKRRTIDSCSPGCSKHLRRQTFNKTERDFDGIQVRASNMDSLPRDLLHHTNRRQATHVVDVKTVGNSSRHSAASVSDSPSPTRSGSFRYSYRCKDVLHRIQQDSPDQQERSPVPIRKKPYGHSVTQGWTDTKDQAACSKRPTNYMSSVTERSCDNRGHLHRVSKRRQVHYLGPPSPYTVACSFRADDLLADTPESPDQANHNDPAVKFVQTEQDVPVDTTQSNPTFSERHKACNIDLSSYNNAELRRLKNWILFGKPAHSSPPSPQPVSGDKPRVEFAVQGMTPCKTSPNKCELKQISKEDTPVPNCPMTEPKIDQFSASDNPRLGTELRSPSVSSTSSTSSSQSSNSSSSGSSESAESSTTNDTTCISSTPSEGSRPQTPTPVLPDKLLTNSFSTRQQNPHANNFHEVGELSQKEVSSAMENNHSVSEEAAELLAPTGADKHEVQMDSSGRDAEQLQEQNTNQQSSEVYCSAEFKVSCPFTEENGESCHGEDENILSNGIISQSVEVNPCSPRSELQEYDPPPNMEHVDEINEEETVFCDEAVSGNLIRSPKKNKLEKRRKEKNSTPGHDHVMDNESCTDRIDGVLQHFETRTSADEEEGEVISDCTSDVDEYHLSKRLRRTPIQEADSAKLSTTSSSEVLRPKMVCRSDSHKHVGSRRSDSSRRRTEEPRFKQPSTPKRKRRDRYEVERLRTSVDSLREQSGFCDRYRKTKYIRSNYLEEPIAYERKTHQQNFSRSSCILKLNRGRPDLDKLPTRGRYLLTQPDSLSRGRGRRMYAPRFEFESDYRRGAHQNRAFQRSVARSVTRFRTSRTFAKPGITHRYMFDLREHKLSRKHQ